MSDSHPSTWSMDGPELLHHLRVVTTWDDGRENGGKVESRLSVYVHSIRAFQQFSMSWFSCLMTSSLSMICSMALETDFSTSLSSLTKAS